MVGSRGETSFEVSIVSSEILSASRDDSSGGIRNHSFDPYSSRLQPRFDDKPRTLLQVIFPLNGAAVLEAEVALLS